jgi:hypothetical protein
MSTDNSMWRCPLCGMIVCGSHDCKYKFSTIKKIDAQQLNNFSFFNEENALVYKNKIDSALSKAVKAIYLDDNSDYIHYLWQIVEILGGQEAVDLLDENEEVAFKKYCKR